MFSTIAFNGTVDLLVSLERSGHAARPSCSLGLLAGGLLGFRLSRVGRRLLGGRLLHRPLGAPDPSHRDLPLVRLHEPAAYTRARTWHSASCQPLDPVPDGRDVDPVGGPDVDDHRLS